MRVDEACKVLELPAKGQVSESQLRQAYKKQCLKHHPDRNLDDQEAAKVRFQAVGDAFQTLERHIKRGHVSGGSASRSSGGGKDAASEETYAGESGDESEDEEVDDDEFEFQEMFRQHFGDCSQQEIDDETRAFFNRLFAKAESWDRHSFIKKRRKFQNVMRSPETILEQMRHEAQIQEQRTAEARKTEEKARADAAARTRAAVEGRDWYSFSPGLLGSA